MAPRMASGHRLALIAAAVLLTALLITGCAPSVLELDRTPSTD